MKSIRSRYQRADLGTTIDLIGKNLLLLLMLFVYSCDFQIENTNRIRETQLSFNPVVAANSTDIEISSSDGIESYSYSSLGKKHELPILIKSEIDKERWNEIHDVGLGEWLSFVDGSEIDGTNISIYRFAWRDNSGAVLFLIIRSRLVGTSHEIGQSRSAITFMYYPESQTQSVMEQIDSFATFEKVPVTLLCHYAKIAT